MTDLWATFIERRLRDTEYWNPGPTSTCHCGPSGNYKPNCPAFIYGWVVQLKKITARHAPEELGTEDVVCRRCGTAWPCEDATDLATIWADHRDYPGRRG